MPHILGDRVYLREYLLSDVEALYQWRTLDEIVWWTGSYLWPESLEQARAFVEAQVNNTDPANRKFAICRREDHKYLGHIGYEHLDLRRQNTEVGIVIGDVASLSRGLGEESLRAVPESLLRGVEPAQGRSESDSTQQAGLSLLPEMRVQGRGSPAGLALLPRPVARPYPNGDPQG